MQKQEKEIRAVPDPQRWASGKEIGKELQDKIQVRAYELYEARGAQPGHELEDWVQAESEVAKQIKLHQAA